ncbi:MAG: NfeD family protein [Bacteroidales bacterium]|nr:NfeD family protein [Bacteroidales bacterium]
MSWTIILIIIVIGLLLVILEVLVIPGTTIAGVLGLIALGIAIWQAFATHGNIPGVITLAGTILVSVIALYFSLKSKTWNKLMLKDTISSQVNIVEAEKVKAGDIGVSVSRLAPMGNVEIKGEYFEAQTFGEFIDPGKNIIVIKTEHSKIFVKSNN